MTQFSETIIWILKQLYFRCYLNLVRKRNLVTQHMSLNKSKFK